MIKAYVVFIERDMTEGELLHLLRRASPEKRERAARLRSAGRGGQRAKQKYTQNILKEDKR